MAIQPPAASRPATCLVVQHVLAERPYTIAEALDNAGVELEICEVFAGAPLPGNTEGYAGIVVMGGPMSATSDEGFPTRVAEVELFEDAIGRGIPALGICLGSQLLAAAAGGKVYAGASGPEIGWGPVSLTEESASDVLFTELPMTLNVLHWHGDTFDMPPGAVALATNAVYPNQAFRAGKCAWGLQFHLEVDHSAISAFISAFGPEAIANGVAPGTISDQAPTALAQLQPARHLLLRRFAELVAGPSA
jgi:GMP synthase-like glutamine amidotransferase